MRVERCTGADAFLALAGPFLAARPAENNLILGIALALQDGRDVSEAPPRWRTGRSWARRCAPRRTT